MKQIFGIKLNPIKGKKWISVNQIGDYPEDYRDYIQINPEFDICEACHIYSDVHGDQYLGFDVSLGLDPEEMRELLKSPNSKIYKILSI